MNAQRITLRTLTHMANEDDPSGKWKGEESETRREIARWAAVILDYPFEGRSSEHQRAIALAFLRIAERERDDLRREPVLHELDSGAPRGPDERVVLAVVGSARRHRRTDSPDCCPPTPPTRTDQTTDTRDEQTR